MPSTHKILINKAANHLRAISNLLADIASHAAAIAECGEQVDANLWELQDFMQELKSAAVNHDITIDFADRQEYPENLSELIAWLQENPFVQCRCPWDQDIDQQVLGYEGTDGIDGNNLVFSRVIPARKTSWHIPQDCHFRYTGHGFTVTYGGQSIDYLYVEGMRKQPENLSARKAIG